jgi:Protein of unknown function (DUF4235)
MKFIFAPIGIIAGLIAGSAGKKVFERLWAVVDDEEPPQPENREVPIVKLIAALAVEGAIFRLVKGLTDHATRSGFAKLTGRWPGDDPAAESE